MASKRKICILTQPLSYGYGGLMQAFALQTILKEMGHSVLTEDRQQNLSWFDRLKNNLKLSLIPFAGPLLTPFTKVFYSSKSSLREIYGKTNYFKSKYLATTEKIYSNDKSAFEKYHFDTYIVGSDQVWRPKYMYGNGSIYNYFLDFTKGKNVKRIAYAASFGVSDWEFTEEQTAKCKELIHKFDAVSVREDDGTTMCENHFEISATHVLDPTLLLDRKVYENLAIGENEKPFNPGLFKFFLDDTEEKSKIVALIAQKLGISSFSIMPTAHFYNVGKKRIDECKFAAVTTWIRAYMDAKFIVTDSFHGTVFSIIFNKPFITIANKSRGLSRFTSLLKIFGLSNRLIFNIEDVSDELIHKNIDFDKVNSIKKIWQENSLKFLKEALS